jgi:hypothetical protein
MGTLAYTSLEQVRSKELDAPSDLFCARVRLEYGFRRTGAVGTRLQVRVA